MSGVGFWELVLVFMIGLIVLGPERLPRVAQQLGGWLGQARRMTRMMKRQLEEELNLERELGLGTRSRPTPRPASPPRAPAKQHEPQRDTGKPEADDTGAAGDQPAAQPAREDDATVAPETAEPRARDGVS